MPQETSAPGPSTPPCRDTGTSDTRLRVDMVHVRSPEAELARDVRQGLLAPRKTLPPKHFYDERGAQLFDAICNLPEYYLTRTEQALLEGVAGEITALTQPADLVEFGSGASRKTRVLLDALDRQGCLERYLPFDVSEAMLRRAARALLGDYPRLRIHAVVGDYEQDLERLPPGRQRLVVFLGSTIGNFTPIETTRFLVTVRRQLAAGEHFLLGVDLVKPSDILEAAYNDSAGVTAAFNRNILHVINQRLDADFEPARFAHVAFFDRDQSQIEMHLRAEVAHQVTIRGLGVTVAFSAGETIHTEISRKFTHAEVASALASAGFAMQRWYVPANNYFGLALACAA